MSEYHPQAAGAGTIGLVTLLCVREAGATPIAITDINEGRLRFAKNLVPNVRTYRVRLGDSPETTAVGIIKAMNDGLHMELMRYGRRC
ncbi:L-arabinitol 4-dehydrogenase [Blastomyces percursus]|uniref:L-arabinitol 4-dehydrogenase n=1 Tax=Blastomyces percursus TaxID=1658174 RepID=A0A1J9R477_9EURO|nr:L-arabinitol 4-dehydrogenase [Blastomyces percursus]